jgi:vacuolar-type H+-ATPase subunit F/Vma7
VKKVIVVTPRDARHGFALAGVRHVVATPETLSSALTNVTDDALSGLIIVDERLLDASTRHWMRDSARRWPGVVVALPAPTAPAGEGEDYVLQLIRRAIGYQVRLG